MLNRQIYLIGMPGSGKSAVGRRMSQKSKAAGIMVSCQSCPMAARGDFS